MFQKNFLKVLTVSQGILKGVSMVNEILKAFKKYFNEFLFYKFVDVFLCFLTALQTRVPHIYEECLVFGGEDIWKALILFRRYIHILEND